MTARETRPFFKMQALENHFVIVDGRQDPYKPDATEIIRICSVGTGVGAEQLVVIEEPTLEGAQARARIYNPDGTEIQSCGNAIRCVARCLMDELDVTAINLEVSGRVLPCLMRGDQIEAAMGRVSFDWQDVPLTQPQESFCDEYETTAVSVGNPHVVVFVPSLDAVDKESMGREIQQHPSLVESANVGFAEVLGPGEIRLQVYERPGVLTQACGSGACAAVAAAQEKGLVQDRVVTVIMPGGNLEIEFRQPLLATMTGPAHYCFKGVLLNETRD